MATAEEIAQVRRNTGEPNDTDPYTDAFIDSLLSSVTINGASLHIWREKAASLADLTNVTEGSSSRSLGDLHSKALMMVKMYEELVADEGSGPSGRSSRTRAIERA